MKKEDLITMIRLVEQDLIQDAKKRRGRDYFDGIRNAVNLIVANINQSKDVICCKDCKYFIVSPDFSCCKLTEAIVGEDDFCGKGARCSQKE